MTTYRDATGQEYPYYKACQGKGDLVIITSDCFAFRVNREVLTSASLVFRKQFEACGSKDGFIQLQHSAIVLALYMQSIQDRAINLKVIQWPDFLAVFELHTKYQTISYGRNILHAVSPIHRFGPTTGKQILSLAGKCSDILTACRVLAHASDWENAFLGNESMFDYSVVEDLPGKWVWAYMRALQIQHAEKEKVNWKALAADFLDLALAGPLRAAGPIQDRAYVRFLVRLTSPDTWDIIKEQYQSANQLVV